MNHHFRKANGWRLAMLKAVGVTIVSAVVLLVVFSLFPAAPSAQPTYRLVQDATPEVSVLPATLQRLSLGAVLAGAVIAVAIQISVNLLAIRMGAASFNPQYDTDPDVKDSVMTGAVWVGIGTLVAMFVGGWIAGRFAGIPEGVDGMLHGLMVWAVVTLVSLFFLGSAVGRLLGGVSTLVGRGLNLAGRVTESAAHTAVDVARGAVGVARGAAHMATDVASGVANTAGNVASDAAHTTQDVAGGLRDLAQRAIDQSPELQDALEQIDLARQSIESEARRALRQAGVTPDQLQARAGSAVNDVRNAAASGELVPEQVKQQAGDVVADVKNTAQQVAQQARQDPEEAFQTVNLALRRVFRKGQTIVNDVDRDDLVQVLVKQGNMNETQARETLAQWEDRFNRAKTEADEVRMQVQQRAEQLATEARAKATQIEGELREKAEDARREGERVAREAAQKTSDAVSQIAGLVFAVIVISGFAAAIGGWIGTPERLPTIEVGEDDAASANHLLLAHNSLIFTDFE